MNCLAKYSVFLSLSILAFLNASSADTIREFVIPVNIESAKSLDQRVLNRRLSGETETAARIRYQLVRFDIDALKVDHRDDAENLGFAWRLDEEFYVSPFPDMLLTAKTKTIREATYDDVWSIIATVKDLDGNEGTLIMSVTDNAPYKVHGDIILGGRIFRTRHINGPYHVIYELDAAKMRGTGHNVIIVPPTVDKETAPTVSMFRKTLVNPPLPQIVSFNVNAEQRCQFIAFWSEPAEPYTVFILTVNGGERYRGANTSTKFSTTTGSQVSVKACIGTECGTPQTRTATCYSGGSGSF